MLASNIYNNTFQTDFHLQFDNNFESEMQQDSY